MSGLSCLCNMAMSCAVLLALLPTSLAVTAVTHERAERHAHSVAGAAMMRREAEAAGMQIRTFQASAIASRSHASIWEVAMSLFDGIRSKLLSEVSDDAGWLTQLPDKPGKVFSQNDEDGILQYLFKNLNSTNKYYVEFGAEDGKEDNTRALREHYGWKGLTMDGSHEDAKIGLHKEFIFPSNIVQLFSKYHVPQEPDLVSVDVDSFDAFVLKKILGAHYRPRVLVIEANDNFGEDSYLSFPGDVKVSKFGSSHVMKVGSTISDCGQTCRFKDPRDGKNKTSMCGAGVRAVDHIASQFGYQSVYLNRVNLFLVRKDLLPAALQKTWTFDKVLQRAKHLSRRVKIFPRPQCLGLVHGLVDVRNHSVEAEG